MGKQSCMLITPTGMEQNHRLYCNKSLPCIKHVHQHTGAHAAPAPILRTSALAEVNRSASKLLTSLAFLIPLLLRLLLLRGFWLSFLLRFLFDLCFNFFVTDSVGVELV